MSYLLLNTPYLLHHYGYWGIGIIVFLESGIFFPLPGDSLLITAGIFASAHRLNLFAIIPVVFAATFLGGIAGYIIGIYIEHLHRFKFFRKILKEEHIKAAHAFFERHGKGAILLSRFVPVIRTFAPIVAGIARMNFKKFLHYSVLSSALWSIVITSLGYFLGRRFPFIINYLYYFVFLVIFASLIPLVLEWYRRRRRSSRTS